jgi:Ca2+-transporting ATPase
LAGLTSVEAIRRLELHGHNRVPTQPRATWWQRLALQLRDPLILVLMAAAVLTIATGDHADAVIIAIVILANTTVGLAQEIKADNAITALQALTAPDARVVRDGALGTLAAEDIVPGDVIVLGEGDVVPADADLAEAVSLLVDESALTGESLPVDKDVSNSPSGTLHAGAVVVHGRGVATVTRTGAASAMGSIAAALTSGPALTPLQRRLADLGRVLAFAAGALCLVVLVVGLARGEPAELMIVTAVSLVVAAVPESLPAVVTLSLALGARRMAARHAIVRRLPAVETLGSVTVIATDKTGTLTEGEVVVEFVWTPTREATFTGTGFDPVGSVIDDDGEIDADAAPEIVHLLTAAVLCNDADVQAPRDPHERWRALGDPTEAALVTAAAKFGLDAAELRARYPRLLEAPFDSDRKRMTTVHRGPDGRVLVVCKGAPERVLTGAIVSDTERDLVAARAHADAYAETGYRVLAIAVSVVDREPADAAAAEQGLRLCGLLAMADPPRPGAASAVAACRDAGIVPVLVTGDHVATARNVAERVGILDADGRAATGSDIADGVPDPRDVSVYARTTPADKLSLVRAWQEQGHVVAMQGDGVNDAPSLRHADIGVAMGGRGTDVARQAADMVLTDDDLGTVVAAVEEGRRVYDNVRRFLLYGLAGGGGEILLMLFGPAVGLALPLLPAQILWINLLTHGLPGVAMGAEPTEPGVMRRPPRPPGESIIGAGLWPRVVGLSLTVAGVALAVGVWAHHNGRPWQSMLFLALATMQFGIALGVRARPGTWGNPFLLVAVGVAFALQLAALYAGPLRELLHTESLSAAEVAAVCGLSLLGYFAARLAHRPARLVR